MTYTWEKSLVLGHEQIDKEHKVLIDQMGVLYDAIKNLDALDETLKTIELLNTYIIEHFDAEENLQATSGYPDYDQHKALHEAYKNDVKSWAKSVENKTLNATERMAVYKSIMDWFRNHILIEDKKLSEFLNQ